MDDEDHIDNANENDYDEEADSDFDAHSVDDSGVDDDSSSGEEAPDSERPRKKRKIVAKDEPEAIELDSGDEATIKEQKKLRKKQQRKGDNVEPESADEADGWRARTRTMRQREQEERKTSKLASIRGSTIDVDKLWEDMNRGGPASPPRIEILETLPSAAVQESPAKGSGGRIGPGNKENLSSFDDEMITIKRTYKFAGEVHTEEKKVLKSSAEARLWLAQQADKPQTPMLDIDGKSLNRPLRKISRFDPNYANIDAFKGNWTKMAGDHKGPSGPKLNVVEKSKMDWAVHVDAEGLKDELETHSRAKEGYLNRMDFLSQVEQRREAEAKEARLKGR